MTNHADKLTVRFYGLILLIERKDRKSARVVLLNAGRRKWSSDVPDDLKAIVTGPAYHHPLLVVPKDSVASYSLPRLPSLEGLVDPEWCDGRSLGDLYGWSISGLTMQLGSGGLDYCTDLPDQGWPTKEKGWNSLGWIPSLSKICLESTLNDAFKEVGLEVLAAVEMSGGKLQCEAPWPSVWTDWVYSFSSSCQQAISDRLSLTTTAVDRKITLSQDGQSFEIQLKGDDVSAWILHEVPPREEKAEKFAFDARITSEPLPSVLPRLRHFAVFYQALQFSQIQYEPERPKGVWRFRELGLQDTPVCIVARVDEPSTSR